MRLDRNSGFQVDPVTNASPCWRGQIAVQRRHPVQYLLLCLAALVRLHLLHDCDEVFALDGRVLRTCVPKGGCDGLQQPKDFLNSPPAVPLIQEAFGRGKAFGGISPACNFFRIFSASSRSWKNREVLL